MHPRGSHTKTSNGSQMQKLQKRKTGSSFFDLATREEASAHLRLLEVPVKHLIARGSWLEYPLDHQ